MGEVLRVENRESSSVKSYRDLKVWQKAMDLLVDVYAITETFPKSEQYGLVSQIRRASVSIPSNLAEGSSRRSTAEFLRYINIASGSLAELETQLIASQKLQFITEEHLNPLMVRVDEISRMLQGLYDSLQKRMNS
jgi:four helix bundle protein